MTLRDLLPDLLASVNVLDLLSLSEGIDTTRRLMS